IPVAGRDLATLRLAGYRRQLGVVLQDNFLFDGTIAENIAFARPHATRREIEYAAGIAHCDDFVRRFAQGYDTVVGERGVKLSGGERQRVSIARAILADPRILILDEATSSLDSESEAAIQDALRTLPRFAHVDYGGVEPITQSVHAWRKRNGLAWPRMRITGCVVVRGIAWRS